jgi:hypothetical protein
VLRHVSDDGAIRATPRGIKEVHLTAVRNFSEQAADERRFAGAVFPDHRGQFAAMEVQVHMLENWPASNARPDIAQRGAALAAAVGRDTVVGRGVVGWHLHRSEAG